LLSPDHPIDGITLELKLFVALTVSTTQISEEFWLVFGDAAI